MSESRTNRRRLELGPRFFDEPARIACHTRDNTIAEQDLITGPVVELMIADAIATHVRETRDRVWWRRLILGVKR